MKWRFAIRYLTARKSHSVINVIASVSLLAVVVPVAAMVILLSVFNGFESLVRDLYKVVDADIEIRATEGRLSIDEQICREVGSVEGIEAYSFMVERQALLRYRDRYTTVLLRGVDEGYNRVFNIKDYTSVGSADVWFGDIDRVMVGEGVAYDLGIYAIGPFSNTLAFCFIRESGAKVRQIFLTTKFFENFFYFLLKKVVFLKNHHSFELFSSKS
ncbi:MAG: hypothetical protein IIW38_01405 [Alistipes sp.]|nr:hypothetical protein [Alistipes sp.]